jgi:hypothetical protein
MREAKMGDHKRRRRVLRVVIAVLVFAAVAEPLVMYRVLMRERADRAMAEAPLAPSTGSPAR